MHLKRVLRLSLAVIIYFGIIHSSFWATWNIQTIREIQSNTENLEQEKTKINFRWSTFIIGNETLGDIIRELSQSEQEELSIIIEEFQKNIVYIEKKVFRAIETNSDTSQKELDLKENRKTFYISLLPYINKDKIESYKLYIQEDIKASDWKTKLDIEIQKLDSKKKERIEELQEKIENNNKIIRDNITLKLRFKVEEKIESFVQSERFLLLTNENKILLFKKLVAKIKFERDKIQENVSSTSILWEKILLLEVVQEIIEEYMSEWEK